MVRALALVALVAIGLVLCSCGPSVSSQDQTDKMSKLDKLAKSAPGGYKVER